MVNDYYETVFADMVAEDALSFTPVVFNADRWYEIDTKADLLAAGLVCKLYESSSARLPDNELNDQIDLGSLQSAIRRPAIASNKRMPRYSPGKNTSVSVRPALPSL